MAWAHGEREDIMGAWAIRISLLAFAGATLAGGAIGAKAADYGYWGGGSVSYGSAWPVPYEEYDAYGYLDHARVGHEYPIYGYGGYIGPYYRNGCFGEPIDCGPKWVHRATRYHHVRRAVSAK
jgi:hypothetical protein